MGRPSDHIADDVNDDAVDSVDTCGKAGTSGLLQPNIIPVWNIINVIMKNLIIINNDHTNFKLNHRFGSHWFWH